MEGPFGQGRGNGWADCRAGSVEDRADGPRALELVEAGEARGGEDAVVEAPRLLALGRGRDDRAEERDVADRDDGGADVLAHLRDPLPVGGAQLLVVRVGARVIEQGGGKADLVERLRGRLHPVLLLTGVDA